MSFLHRETAHPVENHLSLYAEELIDRFPHGQLRRKRPTDHSGAAPVRSEFRLDHTPCLEP